MKLFKTLLILLAIAGIVFSTYAPAQTKQVPCCSCCKGPVCTCGCSSTGPFGPSFGGLKKDGADGTCDFNKCDNNSPVPAGKTFLINSTDDSLKKKLVLGIQSGVPAENACSFLRVSSNSLCAGHFSLPPPLFLKNSCLLL